MQLRPIVIVIQSSFVIVTNAPLSAKLCAIPPPYTVYQTVPETRLRVVVPVIHVTPESVAGMFNQRTAGIQGVNECFGIRMKVSVQVLGQPQGFILSNQSATRNDSDGARHDQAVYIYGAHVHLPIPIRVFQHRYTSYALIFPIA